MKFATVFFAGLLALNSADQHLRKQNDDPKFIPHGVLPLGTGAYLWDKAVQERTVDMRKVCEEAKSKGDYNDKMWVECYKLGGDYTDVRPIDHERAAALGYGPQPMVEPNQVAAVKSDGAHDLKKTQAAKEHSGAMRFGWSIAFATMSATVFQIGRAHV